MLHGGESKSLHLMKKTMEEEGRTLLIQDTITNGRPHSVARSLRGKIGGGGLNPNSTDQTTSKRSGSPSAVTQQVTQTKKNAASGGKSGGSRPTQKLTKAGRGHVGRLHAHPGTNGHPDAKGIKRLGGSMK